MRAIACLSIVLLHAIKIHIGYYYEGTGIIDFTLLNIAGILAFATPAFVFISEFLLARNYLNGLPEGFFIKRFKFILVPYIVMAIFFAFFLNYYSFEKIIDSLWMNILGNYHGWFILVVFQFYALHHFFGAALKKLSSKIIISLSLIINVAYLAIFNFIDAPSDNSLVAYFWKDGYFKLFFAWTFYFGLAYVIGRNYEKSINLLKKYKNILYIMIPISLLVIIINNIYFEFGFGSKRFDMLMLTSVAVLLFFLKFHDTKIVPFWIDVLSRYSFGIYLFHYFFLHVIRVALRVIGIDFGYGNIVILFIGSVIGCLIVVDITSRIPYGEFILGKVKRVNWSRNKTTMHKKEMI